MISLLMPTRGRPHNMRDVTFSARDTAVGEVELCFAIDDDDEPSIEMAQTLHVKAVVGPRHTLSACYNDAAEVATGDLLMGCCDSVLFLTPGWDEMVQAEFDRVPDKILLVYGDDEIHHGGGATLPFLHRRWMEVVGRFYAPYFSAEYVDTWCHEIAKSLGRAVYLPNLITQHRHPLAGTAPMDKTHEERMARIVDDDVAGTWLRTAPERLAEADLLRAAMS